MSGLTHPLAWWLANDIVLTFGQQGIVSDIGWYKTGDGNNKFSALKLQGLNDVNSWFSFYGKTINKGSELTTAYHATLIGGTLVQEGGWTEFEFDINVASNGNPKNIFLKFSNQELINYAPGSGDIKIKGKIKIIDYTAQKAYYSIEVVVASSFSIYLVSGELSGLNFAENNVLILQLQGAANGDITANGGDGKICIIARF